jgi:hypothetical protein
MLNRSLGINTLLFVASLAQVRCGGDSSPGFDTNVMEGGAPDAAMRDASADSPNAVADSATFDVHEAATSDATVDATDGGVDSSDARQGSQDGAPDADVDGSDSSTDASGDGSTDGAADAGPVRLACGNQMCNAGEFCGTPPVRAADAGDGGDATTGDGSLDAAPDESPPDATGSADAADDASLPDASSPDATLSDASSPDASPSDDGSPDAATDGSSPEVDASPEGASNASAVRCESATFAHLCDNPSATVFFDQYDTDNQSALMMANALQEACQVTIISPMRNDAGAVADPNVLDPVSGQAKTGIGNLCLIGGGAFGQRAVAYIDDNSLSDVVVGSGLTDAGVFAVYFTDRTVPSAPKNIAVEAPYSASNSTHDFFLLQLTVDPRNGSTCLGAIGLTGQGTLAAGYYAAKRLIENGAYATTSKSWLLYEWTDEDDGGTPDDNDTYTLVASGP